MKNINLIIDFDSTFVKVETLDTLAKISLENTPNKNIYINQIANITSKAMNGEMPFDIALLKRIKLLKATQSHINKVTDYLKNNISESIKNNQKFFKKFSENCYIVSGGFKEIILPIVEPYGFRKNHVFGNTLIFKNNQVKTINISNPLSKANGKITIVKNINISSSISGESKTSVILGDGYTDYEIKKYNEAKYFIQFIENINRRNLNSKADKIAKSFDDVINYIKKINE